MRIKSILLIICLIFQHFWQVAVIVGTILVGINQGDVILAGAAPNMPKVILTYIVPYCVATYGAVTAKRAAFKARKRSSDIAEQLLNGDGLITELDSFGDGDQRWDSDGAESRVPGLVPRAPPVIDPSAMC